MYKVLNIGALIMTYQREGRHQSNQDLLVHNGDYTMQAKIKSPLNKIGGIFQYSQQNN